MARPLKKGLDYFPMDCNLDNKMKAVIRKYGAEGLGVVVTLFQHIYLDGYYLSLHDNFSEDISLELSISEEKFKDILRFCIKREIFNKELFETEKILTSRGIQTRYVIATERRKCSHLQSYCLLNDDKNIVNVDNNSINDNKSTQSKVKESKVKESKVKESKVKESKVKNNTPLPPTGGNCSEDLFGFDEKKNDVENTCLTFDEFWNMYEKKGNRKSSLKRFEKIKESDRQIIKDKLPLYIKSKPNKIYRKDAEKWLNLECWNDEIELPQADPNEVRIAPPTLFNDYAPEFKVSRKNVARYMAEGNPHVLENDRYNYHNPFFEGEK